MPTHAIVLYTPDTPAQTQPKLRPTITLANFLLNRSEPQDAFLHTIRAAAQDYQITHRMANFMQWLLFLLPRDALMTTKIPQSGEAWLQKAADAILLTFHNNYQVTRPAMIMFFNLMLEKLGEGMKSEALSARLALKDLFMPYITYFPRQGFNALTPQQRLENKWSQAALDNNKPIHWGYCVLTEENKQEFNYAMLAIQNHSPLHYAQWLLTYLTRRDLTMVFGICNDHCRQLTHFIFADYRADTHLLSLEKLVDFYRNKFAVLLIVRQFHPRGHALSKIYHNFTQLLEIYLENPQIIIQHVSTKEISQPPVAVTLKPCQSLIAPIHTSTKKQLQKQASFLNLAQLAGNTSKYS